MSESFSINFTLLLFQDEGVKQFERFVDVKSSSVAPLSGKKRSAVHG